MHELSIVENIISIAKEAAEPYRPKAVESIELEIGELAGIEMSAFDFAWDIAVHDTVLEKAERKVYHVKAWAQCMICKNEFSITHYFDTCPNCGSPNKEILGGDEFKVKRITIT